MQLSIVSTLYYSATTIDEFINRVTDSAQQITQDYELIIVNDGSPDEALKKVLAAQQLNHRIIVIDLSRNFGHHEAGMVGMEHAQGDFVFLIDSDLEEAPELLSTFWETMQHNPDLEVVYGIQEQRKGNWFEKISGFIFYKIFNWLSPIQISPNTLTIRLMKQQYVNAITQYQERNLFLAGVMAHAGFNQQPLIVNKKSKGTTSYSFSKRLKLFIVCITSFTSKLPLYLLTSGSLLVISALLVLGYYSFNYLLFASSISNINALVLATSLILGCLFSCTGLIGFYLASISTEVKQRPRAVIRSIFTKQQISS